LTHPESLPVTLTCMTAISYWLDFGCSFIKNQAAWRFPVAFQIFFCIVVLAFILEMPESPRCVHSFPSPASADITHRWLILKGQEDDALDVLACLADKPLDDKYVNAEFEAIKDTVLEQEQATFRDLFTMDENRHFHRVVLAYCNQVLQQITGKFLRF
jgi:hypothetical protein